MFPYNTGSCVKTSSDALKCSAVESCTTLHHQEDTKWLHHPDSPTLITIAIMHSKYHILTFQLRRGGNGGREVYRKYPAPLCYLHHCVLLPDIFKESRCKVFVHLIVYNNIAAIRVVIMFVIFSGDRIFDKNVLTPDAMQSLP